MGSLMMIAPRSTCLWIPGERRGTGTGTGRGTGYPDVAASSDSKRIGQKYPFTWAKLQVLRKDRHIHKGRTDIYTWEEQTYTLGKNRHIHMGRTDIETREVTDI